MCWEARECSYPKIRRATFRATTWTALKVRESVGIFPELNNHPIAKVLSQIARVHSEAGVESRHSIQTLTAMLMNSPLLASGILMRQANPRRL
jgi:hypothetical protein